MRIIAGKYRGKKLFSPVSEMVRPTSDRARESIFNILKSKYGRDFSGLKLLDIFAGTGAFGLEALSQGFDEVYLIDLDTSSLLKNTALFKGEKFTILKADATKLPKAPAVFDIVFMDAPYHKGLSERTLESLLVQGWISSNSLIIIETEKREPLAISEEFETINERVYGLAKFVFLKVLSL